MTGSDWNDHVAEQAMVWRYAAQASIDFYLRIGGAEPSDAELPQVIQDRMMVFAQAPQLTAITALSNKLASAGSLANWEASEFIKAKDDLAGWQGSAAENFRDYLTDMHGVGDNIDRIVSDLSTVTAVHQAVVQGMQEDLATVVEKHSAALEAQHMSPLEIAATVLGAVSAVVGGVAGGATVVSVVAALTGGAASGAQSVSAGNEVEVWRAFALSLRYLREAVESEMQRVIKGYRFVIDEYLLNPMTLPGVNPDAPKLITQPAFDPRGFELPDSPTFERNRHRVDTSDLVPMQSTSSEIDTKLDTARKRRKGAEVPPGGR